MKLRFSIIILFFTLNTISYEKKAVQFKCPKKFILKAKSNLPKDTELFGNSIELKYNGKFSMYGKHPKTMTMLKPYNAGEFGKKPLYWLYEDHSEMTLACSYNGKGHFTITNIVLKKIKGKFKKCTSLTNSRGVSCF